MSKEEINESSFILTELQRGQERAFDFIFRKYYKSLCAQANAYVNDLDKAQSLVQDCFIKLWTNHSKAGSIKNLPSYLSFMVRNQCVDYLRSVRSIENMLSTLKPVPDEIHSDGYIMAVEFEERMVEALSLLPPRSREAFELSRFEELSYKEIAHKMGISVKAVEALVGRSLKILRKELKDYLPLFSFFL